LSVKETTTDFFNTSTDYVLFSGTGVNGNGPIRHLNDLFIILYLFIKNSVPKENIYLSLDTKILDTLDETTDYKKFKYFNDGTLTFKEVIFSTILEENIIDIYDFEKIYNRDGKDLVFIASGHGSISGLEIGDDISNYTTLSSDYFEKISSNENKTLLIMSQCQAAAFHHLDTRKNICVMGASDYQSSVSLNLKSMLDYSIESHKEFIDNFTFKENIPINPFIFSLFYVLSQKESLIVHENKHLINIFKYTAASTLDYLSKSGKREIHISKQELLDKKEDTFVLTFNERVLIQQPFLLNKIMAANIYI
jgi:hypothetical protein